MFPKLNVVVTGPESSGKTWLANALSAHYKTIWTPEFARSYLKQIDRPYEEKDLLVIAQNQLDQQKKDLQEVDRLLFSDTGLLVMKIWSTYKYGRTDPWIDHELANDHYDLYLLCYPDLDWEFDPLRENQDNRDELFHLYQNILDKQGLPYALINGQGDLRLQKAINAVDQLLKDSEERFQ
ncbi:MAG: ATPase [Bacteroidetes bacterium]|nr:MAG: ATPase [Bacteroidota bacterium]